MSHQMHRATGVSLAILDDAPGQAIGLGDVPSPAAQVIQEEQDHARRPVEDFDGRLNAAVSQSPSDAVIDAAFSFNPRQHQHQAAFEPLRRAQVVEQSSRESAEADAAEPPESKGSRG